MISAFSIRIPRVILVLLIPLNIILLFTTLLYLETFPIDYISLQTQAIHTGFKSFANSFDFSYLGNKNYTTSAIDTFKQYGYQIKRKNVKFKYINSKNKQGTPEEILALNKITYDKVASQEINEPKDFDMESIRPPQIDSIDQYKLANATIVSLVRNNELSSISRTIKRFERKFNSKFNYPYTFINDQPFTDRFKKRMRKFTSAKINYVTIPKELWDKPSSIDVTRETRAMNLMKNHNVAYAQKGSYHNMCRFYLGNFYNVPELQQYKYYWRIEPDVHFYTDLNYDIFKYMEGTKKKYGFTINLYDIDETVASLWPETLRYLNAGDNYKYINPNGAFQWLLENQQNPKKNIVTGGYSTCHFWSNFEIGDMDFFRGEAYSNWFKFLDSTGNFYYERWGDAPVHSMGLALFADKKDIHWFRDVGYFHDPYVNCPNNANTDGCKEGQFSRWGHLSDQNCMASWIDYSMDDPSKIY